MTYYFKELITALRKPSDVTGKEHHLFLLGTAVNYVDRPTDPSTNRSYIRGETFSYTAQLMTLLLGEQESTIKFPESHLAKSPNYAHAYHSNSVDVINGADTPGYEVGDRLAKALMLALGAIAEGKTQLSISGFSRGGVESIVLTHELARVREALEKDLKIENPSERRSFATIVSDSKSVPGLALINDPSYTRKALTGLVTNEKLDDEQELKLNLLNKLNALQVKLFVLDPVPGGNLGKVVRIGWQEESFYTLPDFVVQKHEFVQKHETSNCFKPIIPLGMPYEIIPGCHGTGDGNQFDHNGYPVPETFKNKDLSGVQDLVLRRWLDFMFPNAVQLDTAIDLGHPELDAVTNAYLPANSTNRNIQLLNNYQNIQENYPAFEWLATRNYTGLGRYMAQRQVHFRQRGNTPITDLDAHGDGKTFLNLQHVKLWMTNKLELSNFFELNLVQQVKWLKENIEYAFKPHDLSQSISDQTHMISRLLMDEKNHSLVQESLSYLVNTVTQTYLRNHLSIEERMDCRNCVANTFDTLREAASATSGIDPSLAKLASSFMEAISRDLTLTMLQHQQSLLSMAYKLSLDAEAVLAHQIDPNSHTVTEETPISWLMGTQKLVADLDLLMEQIIGLETWCDQKMMVDRWSRAVPLVGANTGEIPFHTLKKHLFHIIKQQQLILLTNGSRILSKMPDALEQKPEELDSSFYSSILKFARVEQMEQRLGITQKELHQKSLELESTQRLQIDTQHQLEQSTSVHEKLQTQLAELKEELQKITEQLKLEHQRLQKQTELNQTLVQAISDKEEQLEIIKSINDSTSQKLTQTELTNKDLSQQITTFEEQISSLTAQLHREGVKLQEANESILELTLKLDQLELNLSEANKRNSLLKEPLTQSERDIVDLKTLVEEQKRNLELLDKNIAKEQESLRVAQSNFESIFKELEVKAEALRIAEAKIVKLEHELELQKQVISTPIISFVADSSKDSENALLRKELNAYRSSEERAAIVTIDTLLKRTNEYFNRLNKSKDKSELFNTKKNAVKDLIDCLEDTNKLPTEQLASFKSKLLDTQDKIKEHRDPLWQRFMRDCARIIALLVSGVGFYRMATGQAPQFFKPSHGEHFVDDVSDKQQLIPTSNSK
ncbi:hypothetical protein [Legionella quateirensis]|uniref:ATPase involved in DNA repair n=1 Tax=Legionella quateirensis TaxID=45072 RepID=A0A378KPK6_9GAMM|nr:hypothetical protein [Legionella quateirensis]KTD55312.1 hypothetical protein Lqua_0029 [Legionella quateirensis]STY16485.1 ATPase involved in DNA repair [Legionella quateirensis]